MVSAGDVAIVYATYHVDVGETPFFVAIDYSRRKVVVSIRGTLSMKVLPIYNNNKRYSPVSFWKTLVKNVNVSLKIFFIFVCSKYIKYLLYSSI